LRLTDENIAILEKRFNIRLMYRGYSTIYPYNWGDSVRVHEWDYHKPKDIQRGVIVRDEFTEKIILRTEATRVQFGSDSDDYFFTHYENARFRAEEFGIQCSARLGMFVSNDFENFEEYVMTEEGDIMHESDAYYWEHADEWHNHPYEDSDDYEEEEGNIERYSFKPYPNFFKLPNEVTNTKQRTPFFGVELEIEKGDNAECYCSDMADIVKNRLFPNGLVYCKEDGSLDNGFEIVSHPMSFQYIKKNEKTFTDALNKIVEEGYVSHVANTCGMHVHISKNAFSTWHLFRFLKFFVENKDFIFKISQRKIDQFNEWCAIQDEETESILYKAKKKEGNDSRRVAVNLHNSQSVEIRIFRGNLNPQRFMKNLEFVDALFCYSRDCSEVTLKGFAEYIKENGQYNNLKSFIKLKNLI
jgi:hypothetical protein